MRLRIKSAYVFGFDPEPSTSSTAALRARNLQRFDVRTANNQEALDGGLVMSMAWDGISRYELHCWLDDAGNIERVSIGTPEPILARSEPWEAKARRANIEISAEFYTGAIVGAAILFVVAEILKHLR
jgi:hypothetical protein